MLRKYLNSKVIITTTNERIIDNGEIFFIQSERLCDNTMLVEYAYQNEICDLMPFSINATTRPQAQNIMGVDEKAEEYKNVIINKDPFGKYTDCPLSLPFENNDTNWIFNVIKNMKNDYIKSRVEYLAKHYNII